MQTVNIRTLLKFKMDNSDNSSSERSLERLTEIKAFIEASKKSNEKAEELQVDADKSLSKLNEVVFDDAFELTGKLLI